MAEKIKLVQGDTRPALVVSLTDENSGAPLGINGATCRMYFRALGDSVILATLVGVTLPGIVQEDGSISFASPYNLSGSGGRVQFNWADGDLNQPAGEYEGEIEVTFPDTTKQTVYDKLKFKIREDF